MILSDEVSVTGTGISVAGTEKGRVQNQPNRRSEVTSVV